MPITMYLMQQKEILEDMESLVLEVVYLEITIYLMILWLHSQLVDMIRESRQMT